MFSNNIKKVFKFTSVMLLIVVLFTGCGQEQQSEAPAIEVKAVKVIQQDIDIPREYAGQIQGTNEASVRARVTGNVVEKYCSGGDWVKKGQALFKIDSRQYESAYLSAQANLAQAQVNLGNIAKDTERFRELYKQSAISEQQLTTQESLLNQNKAVVNAQSAVARQAGNDLNDTLVVSPIDGRLDVNDVSVGTFVTAGNTVLVTVGQINPIFIVFNMSETEYLDLRKAFNKDLPGSGWGESVEITLSNGEIYPFDGKVTQVDKELADNSSTLTIKATVENPDGVLIPGMFARTKIGGIVQNNVVLIPQRCVQQVLDKSFVMVVTDENKAEARAVTLGDKVGSYWIVKEGLSADETVIIEGLTKLETAENINVVVVDPKEMNLSLEN